MQSMNGEVLKPKAKPKQTVRSFFNLYGLVWFHTLRWRIPERGLGAN